MGKIIRTSMKDQMYDIIKERIFNQEYKLGDPINIVELSKEFGISNTPIREAINMLVAEGLLTSSLSYKFRVIELNEKNMTEINEAVSVILCGSYQLACRNGGVGNLPKLLETALEKQKNMIEDFHETEYIFCSLAFDRCFVEASNNEKLISVYDNLSNLLYLSVRHAYQKTYMGVAENLKQHEQLLEAVKSGAYELVLKLLQEHYDKPYEEV